MWLFSNHLQCQVFPVTIIASVSYTVYVLVSADREPMVNTEITLLGNCCDCLIEANLTASGHSTTISCPHHLWVISTMCWFDGVCQAFVAPRWNYVLSCFNLTDIVQFMMACLALMAHNWDDFVLSSSLVLKQDQLFPTLEFISCAMWL